MTKIASTQTPTRKLVIKMTQTSDPSDDSRIASRPIQPPPQPPTKNKFAQETKRRQTTAIEKKLKKTTDEFISAKKDMARLITEDQETLEKIKMEIEKSKEELEILKGQCRLEQVKFSRLARISRQYEESNRNRRFMRL